MGVSEDSLPDGWTVADQAPESRLRYDSRPHDLFERTDRDLSLQVAAADPEDAQHDLDDYRVEVIAEESSRTSVEVEGHDTAVEVAREFMRAYDAGDERPGDVLRSVAED